MENFHCSEKGKKRMQLSMVDTHDRFIECLDDPILKGEEAEKMEKLALAWIEENMKGREWPEDDWIALGDDGEYDLNLWLSPEDTPDDPGTWRASVYRVLDGSTDTSRWVRVNLPLS